MRVDAGAEGGGSDGRSSSPARDNLLVSLPAGRAAMTSGGFSLSLRSMAAERRATAGSFPRDPASLSVPDKPSSLRLPSASTHGRSSPVPGGGGLDSARPSVDLLRAGVLVHQPSRLLPYARCLLGADVGSAAARLQQLSFPAPRLASALHPHFPAPAALPHPHL